MPRRQAPQTRAISVFDMFKIGIGPSSSHTVEPMRAARLFAESLVQRADFDRVGSVRVELYGSLGATGRGHDSDVGAMLGLMGELPDTVDPATITMRIATVRSTGRLTLMSQREIAFAPDAQIHFYRRALPEHPNGIRFCALDLGGEALTDATFFSIGGGFVVEGVDASESAGYEEPYPFASGDMLLAQCTRSGLSIAGLARANEQKRRSEAEITEGLLRIWEVMRECVERGCGIDNESVSAPLPGPFGVIRRAPNLYRTLSSRDSSAATDPLAAMDWVTLYAMAVNEESAAGGRVVTAPTNGAAGIIPAVLHYFDRFYGATTESVCDFLLTSATIGSLYKRNASISGAEVGCQGEVGVASSMAAAGLAAVPGGTPTQVEHAAEIAMEHHLGLTCDPVGGRVQIPCIERNAVGAVKAIHAARMALQGNGEHCVSLDSVIRTMWQTGLDMKTKYKETSRGSLAQNVIEC
jgi:L-serine dehydratase